jgi:predicted PurR-regulated permease PerM
MGRRASAASGLPRSALAQATVGVLFLVLLIFGALWVLRPFIGPAIWAAMIVIATWPLMRRVQALLWGRRALATTVMCLGLLLLFVVPLVVTIGTIVGNADLIVDAVKSLSTLRFDQPPAWMAGVPLVGGKLVVLWHDLVALGLDGVLTKLTPYVGVFTRWFVSEVGGVGFLAAQFLLTVLLAAVMYQQGEAWASMLMRVGDNLGGPRGHEVVRLAGMATRGVALGVGVTAIVQSALGGIVLAIAGVPFPGLLTAVMVMLCLAQLGPLPVLLGAAGWLFWKDQTGWAMFMLVASATVGTIDNVIRPVLIRLGADLPLLLILTGVVGGLFAFGLVGIFVGPVVLAVAWTLMDAWAGDGEMLNGTMAGSSLPAAVEAVPAPAAPAQAQSPLEQAAGAPPADAPRVPPA